MSRVPHAGGSDPQGAQCPGGKRVTRESPARQGKTMSAIPEWRRFENAARAIPQKELTALPLDEASGHDPYLYSLPKHSA